MNFLSDCHTPTNKKAAGICANFPILMETVLTSK
jgi:hypothetical protein